ncbi:hypothetical protein [Streptomyces sp. NBC_01465]|uniref:hypothetical protein n=1 Tax=Streptomyces sp. NBC_01465 TaxID=2903878 RepID=UPI002E33A4A7|nr:hypothetical protein [Streptomyces sp. NBC_01465]
MSASSCAAVWWARDGGWQIVETDLMEDPDSSIVDETAAPVMVCHVVDSDFVTVQAHSPGGVSWQCALSPVMARDYEFPEEWIGIRTWWPSGQSRGLGRLVSIRCRRR